MAMHVTCGRVPPSVTEAELVGLFSTFGTVLTTDIARTQEGHSMGFAEVIMAQENQAARAIEALHRVYMETLVGLR